MENLNVNLNIPTKNPKIEAMKNSAITSFILGSTVQGLYCAKDAFIHRGCENATSALKQYSKSILKSGAICAFFGAIGTYLLNLYYERKNNK